MNVDHEVNLLVEEIHRLGSKSKYYKHRYNISIELASEQEDQHFCHLPFLVFPSHFISSLNLVWAEAPARVIITEIYKEKIN